MQLAKCLMACLVVCALAFPASALESSAGVKLDNTKVDVGANMQVEALKAWALAALQGQQTLINNINNCSKQNKFWNGTTCVSPNYTMGSPSISTNTVSLPLVWTFAYKTCTKKKLGICTRNDNFCQSSCSLPAKTNYRVYPDTNSIVIDNYVCSGGGQVKNVGNGGC